jgi:uncharacterized protein
MDTATRLRRARVAANLSQKELAGRSGTSQPTLSAYERGKKVPTAETIRRLLEAAQVRPSMLLAAYRQEVLSLCRHHGATDVRAIGSVARNEDTFDSDIDLLVRFKPGTTLFDFAGLVDALSDLLGLQVDVISEGGLRLPEDQHVLDEAQPL